jgi:hypothetical protein
MSKGSSVADTKNTEEPQKTDQDTPAVDDIIDAEVIQEEPAADSVAGEDTVASDETESPDAEESTDEAAETDETTGDADEAEDAPEAEDSAEDDTIVDAVIEDLEASETDKGTAKEEAANATPPVPPVAPTTVVEKKGGAVPMIIGGVIAGLIGFGAGQAVNGGWPFGTSADDSFQADTTQSLSALQDQLSDLEDRVDAAEGALNDVDFEQLAKIDGIDGNVQSVSGAVDGLSAQLTDTMANLDALTDRLDALERRPIEESVSPEAIAAYERELENLRLAMEGQRSEIETMARDAVAAEQSAQDKAQLARARAALADVQGAVDTGAPYADSLTAIATATGTTIPEGLAVLAEQGVPTLAMVIEGFPPAAREALAAARALEAETATGGSRVSNFFRDQLGARSVTPRDGDDADAILSRAEAAVKSGDLATALSEVSALPEPAQAAMSDWTTLAQSRLDAVTGADALAQELNNK